MKPKTTHSKRERFAAFAEAYLNAADSTTYLNAYQSALKAGYGTSYARSQSYKLLDNVGIRSEIERIRTEKRGNPKIATADEVLERLTTVIRVLPNKLVADGELIPLDQLTDELAQAVAGFEVIDRIVPGKGDGAKPVTERRTKYKLIDRLRALELLARYHGLFDKDNRQKAPTAPQALVAFPTGPMTLEEWQAQAQAILTRQEQPNRRKNTEELLLPQVGSINRSERCKEDSLS
jgi:hypothetical protein